MPEAVVNGVRLYFEEHGAGAPILCIHGTSGSAMAWRGAVPELAGLGRVIAYDRRGSWRSERPANYQTSVAQHADDAAALLEALDASPAVVIGRSYGGAVAVDLCLRYPQLVRALALLEPALDTLDPAALAYDEELLGLVEAAAARDVGSVAEVFLRRVLGDATWESFSPELRQMFSANSEAILAEMRGGKLQVGTEDLARIDVPTLVVAGEDSPPEFRRLAEQTAADIPGARLLLVGGGHMIDPADPRIRRFIHRVLEGEHAA